MAKGTPEEAREHTMRYLVMNVGRAFYDTRSIVILDQLARHEVLKDDELGQRSGINGKELGKLLHQLTSHGLVTVHRQNTSRTGETNSRITSKGYYYIDHSGFCNVVKWRIAKMRQKIEEQLKDGLAQQGYLCPQCGKTFQPLDIQHLVRPGGLFCDQCDHELVNNQNKEEIARSKDRMQRFNAQTERIRDGLKQTDGIVMKKVDILDWIKKHPTIVPNADGEMPKLDGELAIAGAKPGLTQKQVYEVVLTEDDNLDQERIAREKEASARRQQNALPTWHTRSTITGDVTAFGLKNGANVGSEAGPIETRNLKFLEDHEEQKNSIDLYYAQQEAEDRASIAQTPMDIDTKPALDELGRRSHKLSVPGSENMSRTYSVSSLKRKLDDADREDSHRSKHSRSTSYQSSPPSPTRSKSAGSVSSSTSEETGAAAHMKGSEATLITKPEPDEPTVFVDGKPFRLSEVTEEHYDQMTPDEYEAYAMIALGG